MSFSMGADELKNAEEAQRRRRDDEAWERLENQQREAAMRRLEKLARKLLEEPKE